MQYLERYIVICVEKYHVQKIRNNWLSSSETTSPKIQPKVEERSELNEKIYFLFMKYDSNKKNLGWT